MATSSIIDNIRVNNPQVLVDYVDFLEAQAKEPVEKRNDKERSVVVTDKEETAALMKKILARHGIQL
ncbi:MAG: hypothetical protein IJI45_03640 [Anaerolineaceae bacterium]|nr:hypothetical protein [Anaerolineaceae bacterium]